jgi:hypothetical protein
MPRGDKEQPDNLALRIAGHGHAVLKTPQQRRVLLRFSTSTACSDRDLRSKITFSGSNGSQIKDRRASISSICAGWYLPVTFLIFERARRADEHRRRHLRFGIAQVWRRTERRRRTPTGAQAGNAANITDLLARRNCSCARRTCWCMACVHQIPSVAIRDASGYCIASGPNTAPPAPTPLPARNVTPQLPLGGIGGDTLSFRVIPSWEIRI